MREKDKKREGSPHAIISFKVFLFAIANFRKELNFLVQLYYDRCHFV
jgi:hypothetical protein